MPTGVGAGFRVGVVSVGVGVGVGIEVVLRIEVGIRIRITTMFRIRVRFRVMIRAWGLGLGLDSRLWLGCVGRLPSLCQVIADNEAGLLFKNKRDRKVSHPCLAARLLHPPFFPALTP